VVAFVEERVICAHYDVQDAVDWCGKCGEEIVGGLVRSGGSGRRGRGVIDRGKARLYGLCMRSLLRVRVTCVIKVRGVAMSPCT
jgi:hypothetical protein